MQEKGKNIFAWVRQILAAPVFEGDEDKTRMAGLLNTMGLAFLVILLGYGVYSIPTMIGQPELLYVLTEGAVTTLLVLTVLFLMRRGRVRWGSLLFSFSLWAIVAIWAYESGGVRSHEYASIVLIPVVVGLLLGRHAAIFAAGLSGLTGLVLMYAEANGLLVTRFDPADYTTLNIWIIRGADLATVAVLLYLADRNVNDALERASRSNRELQATQLLLEKRIEIEEKQREDLQQLTRSEQQQREYLQHLIIPIREAIGNLGSTASEILTATTQQATGSNEQSAAISQTTIIVDEVKTISEQVINRAQKVAASCQRTVEVSHSGEQVVRETVGSMVHIQARVENIAKNILALSEQILQIGEITVAINDITEQSNLLALNASMEAARAHEYGQGFAVIATEVRNLAEQSRRATVQVKGILLDIQNRIIATMTATEKGARVVDQGMQLAAQTQEVIDQLAGVIDESAQAAMQMVADGQQQASGVEQIVLATQSINQATIQSLLSTRQTEKAAQDLNELARGLTETVEQYRLWDLPAELFDGTSFQTHQQPEKAASRAYARRWEMDIV